MLIKPVKMPFNAGFMRYRTFSTSFFIYVENQCPDNQSNRKHDVPGRWMQRHAAKA